MNEKQLTKNLNTFRGFVESSDAQKQLSEVIPKRYLTVDQLARISLSVVRYNPKLQECTPQSLLVCVMGCARLGLVPEPYLGQAYFVPFYNSKLRSFEATLIPGYRGYVTLARRSGALTTLSAQAVYHNDHFQIQFGLYDKLEHIPADNDRGAFKGAWTVFKYLKGDPSFEYMSKADIDAIRDRSRAKDSGPWKTDYSEMAKKTVIRRHMKLAPLAIENPTEDIDRLHMAARTEDMALIGESQKDFFLPGSTVPETIPEISAKMFDKKINTKVINLKTLNEFISIVAAQNHLTIDEVKIRALDDFDEFMSNYKKWVLTECEKEDSVDDILEWAEWLKKWNKLPSKSFKAFVKQFIDKFKESPGDLQLLATKKWNRFFPGEKCPIVDDISSIPSNDKSAQVRNDDSEGGNSGEASIDPRTAASEFKAFTQTDEYQEFLLLKSEHPDIFESLTGDYNPTTVEGVRAIVKNVNVKLEQIVDDIPDGTGKF